MNLQRPDHVCLCRKCVGNRDSFRDSLKETLELLGPIKKTHTHTETWDMQTHLPMQVGLKFSIHPNTYTSDTEQTQCLKKFVVSVQKYKNYPFVPLPKVQISPWLEQLVSADNIYVDSNTFPLLKKTNKLTKSPSTPGTRQVSCLWGLCRSKNTKDIKKTTPMPPSMTFSGIHNTVWPLQGEGQR